MSAHSVQVSFWGLTCDNGSMALDSVFSRGVCEVESRRELPMTERLGFRASWRLWVEPEGTSDVAEPEGSVSIFH